MFESRFLRDAIVAQIFFLALDFAVLWVIAGYLEGPYDNRLTTFLILFGLLYAAMLLLWLRASLWSWLTFLLWRRKGAARAVASGLIGRGLPPPSAWEQSPAGFFTGVMNDERQSVPVRIAAAMELAVANYAGRSLQESVRLTMIYEDALTLMRLSQGR